MNEIELVNILASILMLSSPLIIAVMGEIITEKAGIVNLSLDGTMLFAAMTGFVVAYSTDNIALGFIGAAIVGMIFAAIIVFGSVKLRKSQVAIGFVLTLLGDDLSAFLGQKFTRLPGPYLTRLEIPYLSEIPYIGKIFFQQNLVVYFAIVLVFFLHWWLNKTQAGLHLRSVGERPDAAFARGVNVNRVKYMYAMIGGALIGIGGASYSLAIKIGWSEGIVRGFGWIALAIVIFGGWSPIRGAVGALFFGATKVLATIMQRSFPEVPVVAFNAIPWIFMILVLVMVGSEWIARYIQKMPKRYRRLFEQILLISPPKALGESFNDR
jgi:general nucleoside transport system permease protein